MDIYLWEAKISRTHFITFGNKGYARPDRIMKQALDSGFFQTTTCYTDSEITPLLLRYPLHFLLRRNQGFGTFIWKPYLLLKKLKQVEYGDLVVYSDLGNHINNSGRLLFDKYVKTLSQADKSIGVFEVSESYESSSYVYRKAVESYYPNFYTDEGAVRSSVYAGLVLARKTESTERIITDWMMLCKKYLTPLRRDNKSQEIPKFIGQDADNGFLPLVLSKHHEHIVFSGFDVNLYSPDGIQLKHLLTAEEYEALDWSALDASPFTLRRDRN